MERLPLENNRVDYTIHSYSSHSAAFYPRNILLDRPQDQSSRWSSGSNSQPQFIILELPNPCLVREITFGKFEKQHVCNMKEFEVYGGPKPTNMVKLLTSGLKNDSEAETFKLVHTISGTLFPVQYIKVVPLIVWGTPSNFNYSIWHVALFGISDQSYVRKSIEQFKELQAKEAIRLCLKYFRQRNYSDSFEHLQKRTKVDLEAPVLTSLYEALVRNGDYESAEETMVTSLTADVLEEYISKVHYNPVWSLLPSNTGAPCPGMRGGHQMCIDCIHRKIYLFGGWEGKRDLGDLWLYDIEKATWVQLSSDTETEGGPDARSCHKMVLNEVTQQMYVVGKYVDPISPKSHRSTLHCYDIATNTWTLLMHDTEAAGGPGLIYDHQMCVDPIKNVMYVFGGRVNPSRHPNSYSGLFMYCCLTNTWTKLRRDRQAGPENVPLESRIGHSMLFDGKSQNLLIFAGHRDKLFKADFFKYSLETKTVSQVCADCSKQGGPSPGFTQRATIDEALGEVYVFSGMIKAAETSAEKESAHQDVNNALWVYNLKRDSWYRAYQNGNHDGVGVGVGNDNEPCPRFAHQFIYDRISKKHYLFGGNAGGETSNRLNDFWELRLERPTMTDIVSHCRYLIRKRRFKELCVRDPQEAMKFLQTKLSEVVNHADEEQRLDFQSLTLSLFESSPKHDISAESTEDQLFEERTKLFEELILYYPKEMKQPQSNLVDLIPMAQELMK